MSLRSDYLLSGLIDDDKVESNTSGKPARPDGYDMDDSVFQALGKGFMSAAGNAIHTINDAKNYMGVSKEVSSRPEWVEENITNSPISRFGRELEEEYQPNYKPLSGLSIASGLGGLFPYMASLGALGTIASRSGQYQLLGANALNAATRLGLPARAAMFASEAAPALTYGAIEKIPESLVERQGAYDDYIQKAKDNGTYVQGETEQQAHEVADNVMRDNIALLTTTGALEQFALGKIGKSKGAKELLKGLLGNGATNAIEEVGQQIFPKIEAGEKWSWTDPDIIESGIVGAFSGAGMHGAGIATDRLLDRFSKPHDIDKALESNNDSKSLVETNESDSSLPDDENSDDNTPSSSGVDANARAVYERFKQRGYSDSAIAGIMGRVQQEHNFNTSNVEEYDDEETGLHLGGYGMFQWNGGRTTAFLEWAQKNGRDPQDPYTQADYAIIEAEERGLTPERMNQMSARDAATLWTDEWEVGEHGNEHEYADEWEQRIKSGDFGSVSSSTPASNRFDVSTASDDDFKNFLEWGKDVSIGDSPETIGRNADLFKAAWTQAGKGNITPEMRQEVAAAMSPEDWDAYDRYRADHAQQSTQAAKAAQSAPMNAPANIQMQTPNLDRAQGPVQVQPLHGQAALTGPQSAGQGVRQQVEAQNAARQEGVQKAQAIQQQNALTAEGNQLADGAKQLGIALPQPFETALRNGDSNAIQVAKQYAAMMNGGMQNANQLQTQNNLGAPAQRGEAGGYPNQNAESQQSAAAGAANQQNQVAPQTGRPTKQEMDTAANEIFVADPENFGKGYRTVRDFYNQQIDEILQPALNTLQGGMQQGVDLVPWTDGSGRQSRSSNNAPWYRDFYKKNGRKPTKTELRQMAKQLVSGDSTAPNVEGWTPNTVEEAQAMQETAARIADLERKIAALDAVKDKVAKGKKKKSTTKKSNKKKSTDKVQEKSTPKESNEEKALKEMQTAILDHAKERLKTSAGREKAILGKAIKEKDYDSLMFIVGKDEDLNKQLVAIGEKYGIEAEPSKEEKIPVDEFLKRQEQGREKSAQKSKEKQNPAAQEAAQQEKKTERKETIAEEEKAAQNGSNEAREQKNETPKEKASRIASSSPAMANVASQLGATMENGKPAFKNEKQANAFLKAALAIEKMDEENYSVQDEHIQELLATREWLTEDQLTKQHKAIADFGMEMGVPVVFFKADPDLHGYHVGGVTFLNVNSAMDLEKTFWHETFHWMKDNNKKLYKDLIAYISKQEKFSPEQLKAYRESIGRTGLTKEETIEEMMADAMMNAKDRVSFMKDLAKADRSLAERLMAWLRDVMNRFQEFMNNPDAGLTNTQKEAMSNWLERHARAMVDGNGQPIFRVTQNREILLADGSPLPSYSFAGRKAMTADLYKMRDAQKMKKAGKSAREIWEKTGWFQGKDKEWRFEIPDNLNDINLDNPSLKEPKGAKLSTIYKNPALYKAYPWLKNVIVKTEKMGKRTWGYADSDEIVLNSKKLTGDDAWESKKTIIHELQHLIQRHEGFAVGGAEEYVKDALAKLLAKDKRLKRRSKSYLYTHLAGEQEARAAENRAARYTKRLSDDQYISDAADNVAEAKEAFEEVKRESTPKQLAAMRKRQALQRAIDKTVAEQGDMTDEQVDRMEELEAQMGEDLADVFDDLRWAQISYDYYKEHRSKLSMPRPHFHDAIVHFGGRDMPYSAKSETEKQDESQDGKEKKSVDNIGLGDYNDNQRELGETLSEEQKETLFDQIESHIDKHIADEIRKGTDMKNILAEFTAGNPAHMEELFGSVKALIRDLEVNADNYDVKLKRLEKYKHLTDVSSDNVDTLYRQLIDELKGVLDYGGFLYREIGMDRQGHNGLRSQVVSWSAAENQRHERLREAREKELEEKNKSQAKSRSDKGGSSNVKYSVGKSNKKSNETYMKAVDAYHKAKDPDIKASVLSKIQKMVDAAAKAAGFENAIPEQTVAYKTRTGKAPQKTVKVYKVFTVAPDGSPTALFIGGTEKLPQNVWLDAKDAYHFTGTNGKEYVPSTQNPYTKGGKTGVMQVIPNEKVRKELIDQGFLPEGSKATKITALAYRPGWHAGTLPFFPQGGMKKAGSAYGNIHRYNQVVFECELAADKDYTAEAEAQPKAQKKGGGLNTREADLQYMPENGFYYYATNPMTHGHPELGMWAISGSLKINRALTQEECDKILAEQGMKPQEWEQGEMNLADLGYTGEKYDAARKTLAPITYDDDGNVIPLSERFNADKDDVRYSVGKSNKKTVASSVKKSVDRANKLDADNNEKAKKKAMAKADPKAAKIAEREAKKAAKKAEAVAKKRAEDKAAGRLIEDGRTEIQRPEDKGSMGLFDMILNSPSRLAAKFPAFKPYFDLADKAMKKLTMLRETWGKDLADSLTLAKDDKGRETLYSILWEGDAQGKEFSDAELKEQGASQEVIDAYHSVRSLMDRIYTALDDARRRPKLHAKEEMTKEKLAELKKQPQFYDVLRVDDGKDGHVNVTYREFANWEKTRTLDKDQYEKFKQDDAIQILDAKQNKDGSYTVKTRETIPHIAKRGGYIPHFFHNFMVRVVDKDGNSRTIDSARTEAEAIKKAKAFEKNLGDGEKLVISPKTFDFKSLGVDENMLAVVLGDKDYARMMQNLQKHGDMTLEEAEKFARRHGKSRFNGQFLQRMGAKGFEESMEWVLKHHVNMSARYVAMQDFKPNALSLFERMYGDFSKDYKGLADYTKDYINDVNGVPSNLEQTITNTLMSIPFYRKYVVSHFGDRAALQLASDITGKVSIAKLGFLNVSSALLNLTQIANAAGYLGDVGVIWNGIRRGAHGKHDQRYIYEKGKEKVTEQQVLDDTGVQYDIGLDSGGGYDKFRPGELAAKSMYFFKTSESIVRRGTVLAAYKAGRERGMDHEQAIEYANEINRKSNFEYGVQDAPNMFRRGSILSQIIFQFKKYPIKELEVMRDMLTAATDKKQKAIFWGTYFMLAGLFQIPFGEWIEEIAELIGFKPGPTVRKWMMEAAGDDPAKQALAKVAMYGAPSLTGIDISQRYGMGGVLPSDMYLGKNPTYLDAALSLMGASTDTAKNIISALRGVFRGDKNETFASLRGISPGVANMVEAAIGEKYDRRGRIATRYDSAYDRILKAIGFRSTKEAVSTELRNIVYDEKEEKKGEKQKAIDMYLDDPTTENARKLRELGVKPDTVKKARQQRKLDNLARTQENMTKKERKEYQDLMKFAK